MANKAISELPQAQNVNNQDLFVLEQSGIAKKLPAETFITEQGIIDALAEALDGHGGIQSVTLASVSGRIRTYRITFTDQSATTFQVYDGTSIDRISRTSSSGLDDVYTIFLSDGTTTFFTVHNGADGDVSEAMLNDALKDKAPAVTETTESGAIANFTDGADDMPIQSLVAEIEPIQDLTYGDPYPAGGSKNLLNMNADITVLAGSIPEAVTITTGEGTASITETYYSRTANIFGWAFNVEENADYTVSCMCSSSKPVTLKIYTGDGTTLYSNNITNNIQNSRTFSSGSNTVLYFYASVTAWGQEIELSKLQIEKSSSATSYMPYANICPITGWTGCNVTRTGKNLMDSGEYTGTRNSVNYEYKNGVLKLTGTASATSWLDLGSGVTLPSGYAYKITVIPIKSRRTPTDNMLIGCSFAYVAMKGVKASNQTAVVSSAQNIKPSLKLTSGQVYDDEYQMLLEFTTLATTEFDPPQAPTTVSLSWQTEAGTVYGGTIDVATGLLTVTMKALENPESLGWAWQSAYNVFNYRPTADNAFKDKGKVVSSAYAYGGAYSNLSNYECGYIYTNHIAIRDDSFSGNVDAFKASLSGIQIFYELATPQTYQLTGQQLMTLLGTNNVWADTGNVSVTYPADTKMFIEKLTMPTEDDLVANQAITSGKYFMIGNSLYLALANIANGAQITIGTNAQRVSLADALNTINS